MTLHNPPQPSTTLHNPPHPSTPLHTAVVPQRRGALGFAKGRLLTFLGTTHTFHQNSSPPPPPQQQRPPYPYKSTHTALKNLRGRESGPSPVCPGP